MITARIKGNAVACPTFREVYNFKNLIPNPSFETDTSWSDINYDTVEHLYGSRSMKLPIGTYVSTCPIATPIVGHKYYGRQYIKTDGNSTPGDCRFEVFAGDGVGLNWVYAWNNGNHPTWTMQSAINNITVVNGNSYIIRCFAVNATANAWIDGLMLIDLTKACGAGNEPSKDWCDKNIPFFEDTYEIPTDFLINPNNQEILCPTLKEGSTLNITPTYIESSKFIEVIPLKNMLHGGDMAGDFWRLDSPFSYDTTIYKYGTRSLKLTATASVSEVVCANLINLYLNKGHIYYGRMEVYQQTAVGNCDIYWPIAEPSFVPQALSGTNTWNLHSWRVGRTAWGDGSYPLRVDFDNHNVDAVAWYDGIMIIDLTKSFGAGNEPSKDWCDKNIPFFNGYKEIGLEEVNWQF